MVILASFTSWGMSAMSMPVVPIWVAPQMYTFPALESPTVKEPKPSIILISFASSFGTFIMDMVGGTLF